MLRGSGQSSGGVDGSPPEQRKPVVQLLALTRCVIKATDPPDQVALFKRSKEVFVGHSKVSAGFYPKLQRSSGCFQGVSPSEGIKDVPFQVPSSAQFQFPDVLGAEFRLDPEFRQRVVGLERMLRVRDSLQATRVVTWYCTHRVQRGSQGCTQGGGCVGRIWFFHSCPSYQGAGS